MHFQSGILIGILSFSTILLLVVSSVEGGQTASLQIELGIPIYDVEWNPSSTHIAVATDKGIAIYDENLNWLTTLAGTSNGMFWLSWSPDGKYIVGTTGSQAQMLIWSVDLVSDEYHLVQTLSDSTNPDFMTQVAWSPDGAKIAVSLGVITGEESLWESIRIMDVQTWQEGPILSGFHNFFYSPLIWSPDSTKIAGGSYYRCSEQMVIEGDC